MALSLEKPYYSTLTRQQLLSTRIFIVWLLIALMLGTPGADCVFEYLRQYIRTKLNSTFRSDSAAPTEIVSVVNLSVPSTSSTTPAIDVLEPSYSLLELLSQHHLQSAAHYPTGRATHNNRSALSIQRSFSLTSSSATTTCCAVYRRCFNLFGDFFSLLRRPINLPPDCSVDVSFILNTRKVPNGGEHAFRLNTAVQDATTVQLLQSDFDPRRNVTVFIIHGFISLADWTYFVELKNALLWRADVNVFRVNWERGAIMPYTQAASNARVVGAVIGQFIEFLVRRFALAPHRVHLIGHSLGAHIAGYAAQELQETSRSLLSVQPGLQSAPDDPTSTLRELLARILITKQRIGRITALDPASPFFSNLPPSVRLDQSDADFVEVFHTDTANLGIAEPLGHVDYFPNGGAEQPGCSDSFINAAWFTIANFSVTAGRDQLSCSHVHAIQLYTNMLRTYHDDHSSQTTLLNNIVSLRPISTEPILTKASDHSSTDNNKRRLHKGGLRTRKYRQISQRNDVDSIKSRQLIFHDIQPNNYNSNDVSLATCRFVAFKCDTYKNFLDAKCVDCSSNFDRCKTPGDIGYSTSADKNIQPENLKYFFLTSRPPPSSSSANSLITDYCVHHIVVAIELARHDKAGRTRPPKHEANVYIRLHYSKTLSPTISKEIALTSGDDVAFNAGQVRTFLIGSRAPLSAIESVSLRWSNTRSSLNPVRLTYALFGYYDPDVMLIKSVALLSAVEPTDHGQVAASAVRARTMSTAVQVRRRSSDAPVGDDGRRLIEVKENAEAFVPMVGWYSVD